MSTFSNIQELTEIIFVEQLKNDFSEVKKTKKLEKSENILGYNYTPEEATMMKIVLDELKSQGMTTTNALLTVFKEYKNVMERQRTMMVSDF